MTRRGRAWEAQLEVQHDLYWREGRAFIARCHHGSRVVSRGGQRQIIFDSKGPPDFMGTVRDAVPMRDGWWPGISIAAEAKEVAAKRWQFSLLDGHQARALGATTYMGGNGLLLLAFVVAGRRHGRLVIWSEVSARYKAGEKSLAMDDPACRPFEGADWLPVFLRWRDG